MRKWEAEVRALFPWLPPLLVLDDGVTLGTVVLSFPDVGPAAVHLSPEFIPGRAIAYHEMAHLMQRVVEKRVHNDLALCTDAYAVRGFPPTVTVDTLPAAKECMAGMLPEAFIGEWAGGLGIPHPLYGWDSGVPGGPSHPQVTAYFDSPASQKVRDWFLGLATWKPSVPPAGPAVPFTIEQVGPAAVGNFMAGRSGNPVALIVMHWTTGSLASALQRFQQSGTQVSAHYIVGAFGRVVQVVQDSDTAYHAGDFPVNQISIGIEHECGPTLAPTELLYASSVALLRLLAQKYHLDLITGTTVKRHNNIVPTACPGTLDVERIVNAAGGVEVTDAEFVAFYNRLIKPGLDATIEAMKSVETKTVVAVRAAGDILTKTNL
jgi:hypothetical protein